MGILHFETHFSKDWALEAILQIHYDISGRFLCFQKNLPVGKHYPGGTEPWAELGCNKNQSSWFMQPNSVMLTGLDEVGAY